MTIRVGIIGCGGIANEHMNGYQACEDVKVTACADLNLERAKQFAKKYGIPKVFGDYRKVLEQKQINAVSVCTPNYAHAEPAIAALNHGIHVLCEKPIAMNAGEAAKMLKAARTGKALLTIGHHMRFIPCSQFLKNMINEGDLGSIYYGRSQALRRRGVPGWGQFHIKEKSGGGPLIDIGVHALDLILWLMGSPEPATVSGNVYTKFGNRPDFFSRWGDYKREDYDVEDFACGYVKFTNGAALSLEACWAAHLPEMDAFPQLILGDKGGALIAPHAPEPVRISTTRGETLMNIIPADFPDVRPHTEEVKHWVACLRGEKEVLVKPEESLNVQRVIDAIYASSESGHEVIINQPLSAPSANKPGKKNATAGSRK